MKPALFLALTPLALAIGSGCTWISVDDWNEKLLTIDNDGDGYTADGAGDPAMIDCDDTDADINPGVEETWYDGLDSDCDGADDYDRDGDTYRHPSSGDEITDCDDANENSHPNAEEVWYDGVDGDCDGSDDYDQDGDGHYPETHDGGDCNDTDASAYLGAEEIWYNGVDNDCLGGDDFDADADGHTSDEHEGDDCDDFESTINPSVEDQWYDGVDSDCGGENDYDQDYDGFESEEYGGDDCNDTNFDINPGSIEQLSEVSESGNFIDYDCNGDPISFRTTTITNMSWGDVKDIDFGESSNRIMLSVAAAVFTDNNGTVYYDTAATVNWPYISPNTPPTGSTVWQVSTSGAPVAEISDSQAFRIIGDEIYGVTGRIVGSNRELNFTRYHTTNSTQDTLTSTISNGDGSTPNSFNSISFDMDTSGNHHIIGCDDTNQSGVVNIQYMQANDTDLDNGLGASIYQESGSALPSVCTVNIGQSGLGASLEFSNNLSSGLYTQWEWDDSQSTPSFNYVQSGNFAPPDMTRSYDTDDLLIAENLSPSLQFYSEGGSGGNLGVYSVNETPISVDFVNTPDLQGYYFTWVEDNGDVGFGWFNKDISIVYTSYLTVDFAATRSAIILPNIGGYVMVAAMNASNVAWGVAEVR